MPGYTLVPWENEVRDADGTVVDPSTTALNKTNLDVRDSAILDLDARIAALENAPAGGAGVTMVAAPTGINDTTLINAARDAAGVGGTVYFPAGTYRANVVANIAAQTWQLHPKAVIKALDTATQSVLDIRADNVTLVGGTIDGNRSVVSTQDVVGVFSGSSISGTTISGVRVQNCRGYGIWLFDNDRYRIENCTVVGTALTGIITQCSARSITDGTIRNNLVDQSGENPATITSHGMTARGGGGFTQSRLVMHGNHVIMPQNPADPENRPICIEAQAVDSTISNNTTRHGAMGISLTGSNRVTVCTNTIFGPASAATQQYGIEIATSPQCIVVGNTIEGLNALSDGIGFSQAGSTDCVVANNFVRQTTGSAINVSGGCPRAAITGNVLTVTTGRGITLTNGSGDATVTGNIINGNNSGGATEGIRVWSLTSALVGALLSSNRMLGFPKGIAVVGAAALVTDRVLVLGNDLTGCTTAWSETYTGGASLGTNVRIRSNLNLADN